jgi:hypothetical protein
MGDGNYCPIIQVDQLMSQKLYLDKITDGAPEVMSSLYSELAAEFSGIGYESSAVNCERRSADWKNMMRCGRD